MVDNVFENNAARQGRKAENKCVMVSLCVFLSNGKCFQNARERTANVREVEAVAQTAPPIFVANRSYQN